MKIILPSNFIEQVAKIDVDRLVINHVAIDVGAHKPDCVPAVCEGITLKINQLLLVIPTNHQATYLRIVNIDSGYLPRYGNILEPSSYISGDIIWVYVIACFYIDQFNKHLSFLPLAGKNRKVKKVNNTILN
jgi:hypothetical protein